MKTAVEQKLINLLRDTKKLLEDEPASDHRTWCLDASFIVGRIKTFLWVELGVES